MVLRVVCRARWHWEGVRCCAKAKEEEIQFKPRLATAVKYNPAVMDIIGPRGGLPHKKTELSKLAVAFGIDPTGMTSYALKARARPMVASGRRSHEEPLASSGRTPPRGSESCKEKAWEWVDPKEQAEIERTVVRRIHGDASQDLLRAVSREALLQLSREREVTRRRLDGYVEDVEVDEAMT